MGTTVQARLDEETQAALERAASELGWSTSKVIREGIHLVEQKHIAAAPPRLIGLGAFNSGIPDLGSNKKHLEGFGVKSMGPGWRRPAKARKK